MSRLLPDAGGPRPSARPLISAVAPCAFLGPWRGFCPLLCGCGSGRAPRRQGLRGADAGLAALSSEPAACTARPRVHRLARSRVRCFSRLMLSGPDCPPLLLPWVKSLKPLSHAALVRAVKRRPSLCESTMDLAGVIGEPARLISAASKALRISLAGLPTRPPRRMSIGISCGWRRSERRYRPSTPLPVPCGSSSGSRSSAAILPAAGSEAGNAEFPVYLCARVIRLGPSQS